jgi:hypothetical protein
LSSLVEQIFSLKNLDLSFSEANYWELTSFQYLTFDIFALWTSALFRTSNLYNIFSIINLISTGWWNNWFDRMNFTRNNLFLQLSFQVCVILLHPPLSSICRFWQYLKHFYIQLKLCLKELFQPEFMDWFILWSLLWNLNEFFNEKWSWRKEKSKHGLSGRLFLVLEINYLCSY